MARDEIIQHAESCASACDYISATCADCEGSGHLGAGSMPQRCQGLGEMWVPAHRLAQAVAAVVCSFRPDEARARATAAARSLACGAEMPWCRR